MGPYACVHGWIDGSKEFHTASATIKVAIIREQLKKNEKNEFLKTISNTYRTSERYLSAGPFLILSFPHH